MTRILLIGQHPNTVDFSDPLLPPGFDAHKIEVGIAIAVAEIEWRGWRCDICMVPPDESAALMIEQQLKSEHYNCVVIGGDLRISPKRSGLFEMAVNTVHRVAPQVAIAFNIYPEDTADAVARQLGIG